MKRLARLASCLLVLLLAPAARVRACEDCDKDKNTWPLHGVITSVNTDRKTVTVTHEESKGLLPAGDDEFFVDPELLPSLQAAQEIVARVDKRKDQLWLVSIGLVPPPPSGAGER